MKRLYDYLYVDLDKVVSLYSQLTGGVVELRETSQGRSHAADNKRRYDVKIFSHDAGGTTEDTTGMTETIKPHHSVLLELEEKLASEGFLLDISNLKMAEEETRERIQQAFCIKVTGRAVIEDYHRMKRIAEAFPGLMGFVQQSIANGVRETPEYQALEMDLHERQEQIKLLKDKNEKVKLEQLIKLGKKKLQEALQPTQEVVEQWILDGYKHWVDTFLPGITNLRIYPVSDQTEQHVLGHLKSEYFQDSDTDSFHFSHGSLPTQDFTLIGLVSAVPDKEESSFNPLAEFEGRLLENSEEVESGFRGLFRSFDGFESYIRTCRYPRILVYPLLVYKSSTPLPDK